MNGNENTPSLSNKEIGLMYIETYLFLLYTFVGTFLTAGLQSMRIIYFHVYKIMSARAVETGKNDIVAMSVMSLCKN